MQDQRRNREKNDNLIRRDMSLFRSPHLGKAVIRSGYWGNHWRMCMARKRDEYIEIDGGPGGRVSRRPGTRQP
jgi:hypothetical protein